MAASSAGDACRVLADLEVQVVGAEALGHQRASTRTRCPRGRRRRRSRRRTSPARAGRTRRAARRSATSPGRRRAARRRGRRTPSAAAPRARSASRTASRPVLGGPVRAFAGSRAKSRAPVAALAARAVRLDGQRRAPAAACARPSSTVRGAGHDGVEGQVVVQRDRVERRCRRRRRPRSAGRVEAKRSAPSTSARYSGLTPEPVAGQERPAGRALDDAEGEHPEQVVDDVRAPLAVALEDDLGVRGRGERVARARAAPSRSSRWL